VSIRGEVRPVATYVWHCESNFLTCNPYGADGKEHLLKFYETGYRADLRRISGHAFLECRQCQPPTYMFVVFSTTPSSMATCYAISRESYDEWQRDKSETTYTTQEMLYRLRDPDGRSLNPYWREPRT
jgi:hypothetical protein